MPNWCEGSLKIRGKFEDVKKFLKEELRVYDVENLNGEVIENAIKIMSDSEDSFWISFKKNAYINGTKRGFVIAQDVSFLNYGDKIVCVLDFREAWGINPEPYLELAKKHDVDIRLYGFEKGMQFNQEVIIENGEIIKDEGIEFDDYDWECIMPNLGG